MIRRGGLRIELAVVVAGALLVTAACGSPALPKAEGGGASRTTTSLVELEPITTELPLVEEPGAVTATPDADTSVAIDVPAITSGDEWGDITANLTGLASDCGNLAFVAGHPQTEQVLAGVALQGIWELNDAGDEWARLGTAAASDPVGNRTTSVLFDPADPERFWQSGSYAAGAFRSDDDGAAFTQLGNIDHLDYISVDLADPLRQTMLAGGHERTEIYRSVNGGTDWTSLAPNLPPDAGFASYPMVIDPSTHLLGTNSGDGSGIFRSTDGGETWSLVLNAPVSSPPVVVGDDIYWLIANGGGLVVSSDAGETFEFTGRGTGGAPLSLVPLPDGRLATHNETSVLVTSDAGATWTPVGPPLPYVPWGLAYSEQRESFYVWRFTCDFSSDDHPVIPMSIMQLDVSLDG